MSPILVYIKWIMLVSGVLTTTVVYAAFAPAAALQSTFGEALDGPLANVIVRNWGALVGLMGVMLIYGAFDPASRPLALVTAGLSKAVFIGLVLWEGARYLDNQAAVSVVVDTVMIALFVWYLVAERQTRLASVRR
jgi:hypothetical protein